MIPTSSTTGMDSFRRNASPYWGLELWDGSDPNKSSSLAELAGFSSIIGGISVSILNKITEIRYKDVFNPQDYQVKGNAMDPFSSLVIRFEGLTKDEATEDMFNVGIGYSLFAGWYDFYSNKEEYDNIFNGVVYKMDLEFDKNGIKIMMNIINPGIFLLYSPLPSWTDLKITNKSLFGDVMVALCDYCGMGGVLKLYRRTKLMTYLASGQTFTTDNQFGTNYTYEGNQDHMNIPARIVEEVGRSDRPRRAADVFSWFAHAYGLLYNVRNNEIWLSEYDMTPPKSFAKIFSYRDEQKFNMIPPMHLTRDPFETVRIQETRGPNYAVTSNTFYSLSSRKVDSALNDFIQKAYRDSQKDNALLVKQMSMQAKLNPQAAVAIQEIRKMSFANQAGALDHLNVIKMRKTPINTKNEKAVFNKAIKHMDKEKKLEYEKAYKSLVAERMKEVDLRFAFGSVLCQIKGAVADFNYKAGERFFFEFKKGHRYHGIYMADFVEYYCTKGSSWKMDVSGRKPLTVTNEEYATQELDFLNVSAEIRTIIGWMKYPDGGYASWDAAAEPLRMAAIATKFRLQGTKYYSYSAPKLPGTGEDPAGQHPPISSL